MCQTCVDNCRRLFLGITNAEMHDLLMNCTAWPFDSAEGTERQLTAIAKRREARGFPANWIDQEVAYADACDEVAMLTMRDWGEV